MSPSALAAPPTARPPVTRTPAPPEPTLATPRSGTPGAPARLLAVVTGAPGDAEVLDTAYATARATGRAVHTALLLPRVPLRADTRLAELADREASDLVTLACHRSAAAGVPARIVIRRLGGLHGRRRQRVLDRTVARLARRLDAVPVGWTAR